MAINEMRTRIALKYEGKTFIEEEDGVLVGCQVGQNRTYCSVCDWDECIDRERASFPEEVAPGCNPENPSSRSLAARPGPRPSFDL